MKVVPDERMLGDLEKTPDVAHHDILTKFDLIFFWGGVSIALL